MAIERATTVLLVRHGRTALNAQGRFRGLAEPPLDEMGMAEAEEAAGSILARSRDRPIAALATSPLARARQTAESIGLAIGREPFVMRELLDLDHGAWEGLTAEEARDRDPAEFERFREDPRASRPPEGESLAQVEQRMRIAVASLAARYPGEQAVAVSHEIPIRLLLSGLRKLDGREVWAFDLPTASITPIERDSEGNWAVDPVQLPKPPIRP
jgi:probable phosphoglycerate mutase